MLIQTNKNQVKVGMIIEASNEGEIFVVGVDSDKQNTFYIKEKRKLKRGKNIHYFSLPLSPKLLLINVQNLSKNSIEVLKTFVDDLPVPKIILVDADNEKIADFGQYLKDIFEFSEKASYLKEGFYSFDNEYLHVHYVDFITNEKNKVLLNPARTFIDSGNMQIAKKYFLNMTVAMRVFVLLHERSHYIYNFEGGSVNDESFADKFAKDIYEALNFPTSEYQNLIGTVLTKSNQNIERINRLHGR